MLIVLSGVEGSRRKIGGCLIAWVEYPVRSKSVLKKRGPQRQLGGQDSWPGPLMVMGRHLEHDLNSGTDTQHFMLAVILML